MIVAVETKLLESVDHSRPQYAYPKRRGGKERRATVEEKGNQNAESPSRNFHKEKVNVPSVSIIRRILETPLIQ